ncbi:hypothetical protein F5X68DRAFT_195503 [Plectosphaerella plurivora]|uniref:Uncharacterized protein n=1 Tax=Plectosphaerella plurivora TaxID=936078 RepID=A0A9P8V138_9PEZI|nr:hypothetical protein F5X68DRAFT_195503 [Plectosphaerella plurivora]
MRFSYAALSAALAATCAADSMTVTTGCTLSGSSCDSRDGRFYTDFGSYKVNASKGCRRTSVPEMADFCVDWKAGRAHFRYNGQHKRCLIMTDKVNTICADHSRCHKTTWEERPCGWRRDVVPDVVGSEEVDGSAVLAQAAATSTVKAGDDHVEQDEEVEAEK